jgi:Family of unknown function (DUF6505)
MALKLPRAIRLDPSDTFVFDRPAEPGEWVVSGAFMFNGRDPDNLATKEKVAFRSGWLGVASFGWSTLAIVTNISQEERQETLETLARRIHDVFNAPTMGAALGAAEEELAFAASLCEHPAQTLLAIQRTFEEGEIRERFRTISPREDFSEGGFKVFTIETSEETEDIVEEIDLAGLSKGRLP